MTGSVKSPTLSLAVKALFESLIDYAGVFPPASLGLKVAVDNYLAYRDREYSWVLSRLLATAPQICELPSLIPDNLGNPIPLSLITKTPAEDLHKIEQALLALRHRVTLASIEVTLNYNEDLSEQINQVTHSVASLATENTRPFIYFEVIYGDEWKNRVRRLLAELRRASTTSLNSTGFKLRCGGLPQSFPTPSDIAFALHETASSQVPIKFTAGLHHPFYRRALNGVVEETSHGYFNVFFAALMAHTRGCSLSYLERVITESTSTPAVSNDRIMWLDSAISAEEIRNTRATRVISFGSCSFDEPILDAVQNGWLR